jgi:hypothetical protein
MRELSTFPAKNVTHFVVFRIYVFVCLVLNEDFSALPVLQTSAE